MQKKFVIAYIWLFGGTQKTAREVFKNADPDYINAVIRAYDKHSRIAFWED